MTNLIENQFGGGAIPKPRDGRDFKASRLGMAAKPFDWEKGFDIEEEIGAKIHVEDQGSSGSCGGQSGRYYASALEALRTKTFERRSAKYIYSQIFWPGGGTTIREIGKVVARQGACLESLVPSYDGGNPPSERFMQRIEDVTAQARENAKLAKAYGYAFANTDIDSIAQAVQENSGAILLVAGSNNGTWRSKFPLPPKKAEWRHFVYAGKAKLIKGKKHIGICNSWGPKVGDKGWQWLGEEYFKGSVEDAMVFYDNEAHKYEPTWLQKFMNWYYKYKH